MWRFLQLVTRIAIIGVLRLRVYLHPTDLLLWLRMTIIAALIVSKYTPYEPQKEN